MRCMLTLTCVNNDREKRAIIHKTDVQNRAERTSDDKKTDRHCGHGVWRNPRGAGSGGQGASMSCWWTGTIIICSSRSSTRWRPPGWSRSPSPIRCGPWPGSWPGTRFHLSEVSSVDLDERQLLTDQGAIPYDYLVLGAGSVTNYFGLESVERHSFDLKELADGETLRNHILTAFERAVNEPDPARKRALMTFVIVGGGPTGVEFAGALIELVHFVLAKDYPELSTHAARVVLVEATDRLLAAMPEKLRTYTLKKLRSMSVEVLLNARVVDAGPERVVMHDGAVIPAHTLFWSAGVKAAPLAAALGVPPEGRRKDSCGTRPDPSRPTRGLRDRRHGLPGTGRQRRFP